MTSRTLTQHSLAPAANLDPGGRPAHTGGQPDTAALAHDQMPNKLCFTVAEACEQTTLSRSSIFELIASGEIAAKKVGRRTLITRDELIRFVAAQPDRELQQ